MFLDVQLLLHSIYSMKENCEQMFDLPENLKMEFNGDKEVSLGKEG